MFERHHFAQDLETAAVDASAARLAGPKHDLRHPRPTRSGATPPVAHALEAPQRGAIADDRAEPSVDD